MVYLELKRFMRQTAPLRHTHIPYIIDSPLRGPLLAALNNISRLKRPDCAVYVKKIHTNKHRMTSATRSDCAAIYVQFIEYAHTYTHTVIPHWKDQCEWQRMTRMAGSDCVVVMRNIINTHTHTHTHTHTGTLSLSKNCTSRESVSPLSRLIRGFRNKYH